MVESARAQAAAQAARDIKADAQYTKLTEEQKARDKKSDNQQAQANQRLDTILNLLASKLKQSIYQWILVGIDKKFEAQYLDRKHASTFGSLKRSGQLPDLSRG